MKIGYAQATYIKDFEETKECIKRVCTNVDCTLISYDQSLDDDELQWLVDNKEKFNIIPIKYMWKDDMPAMRNSYLDKAKELNIDWLCVSDPDELYSPKLAENIRSLIEKYDKEGYSIIGVPAMDQFEGIDDTEWFDNLDKIKEIPMGYHETDYYKPLLCFKIFPDIRYEGIGIQKNVHETLLTQYKQKSINLPKEYFYIHKKNVLKIWRNAARNLFIGGGGDNVGNKNRLWIELRQLCNKFGINTWNEFEEFVNIGIKDYSEKRNLTDEQKKEFRSWLEAALKALPTKEGTETRETGKWYYAIHKDEVDEQILKLIKTVPEISEETELENFVTRMYYNVLKRHPDRSGLDNYIEKIKRKEMKRSDLAEALKTSTEYRDKFSGTISYPSINMMSDIKVSDEYKSKLNYEDKLKYDKIEKFVNEMYKKVLKREGDKPGIAYYTESVMRRQIKPVDLPDIFRRSEEFENLYRQKTNFMSLHPGDDKPSKQELKMVNLDTESHNTIGLCIMGTHNEIPMIKESIMTMKDVVDEIHIQTDDFTGEDIDSLMSIDKRIQVHVEKWKDHFSDYKNRCYSNATTEWIVILDADEIPTKELAEGLKDLIKNSDRGNNYDMIQLSVIDEITENGKIVSSPVRNNGGKANIHWNIPSVYVGRVHIHLKENYYPFKSTHSDLAYIHRKEQDSILQRSCRNVVQGGGGDTWEDKNPCWRPLQDLRKELELTTWKSFDQYLHKGNIDIRMLNNFRSMYKVPWKDDELTHPLRYYIRLFPDEKDRIN